MVSWLKGSVGFLVFVILGIKDILLRSGFRDVGSFLSFWDKFMFLVCKCM